MEYWEVEKHVHLSEDGVLTVDPIQLPTGCELPTVDQLTRAITRAVKESFDNRRQREHEAAMDPATYGLAIGELVHIGSGKTVWMLQRIESSWEHYGRYNAILYATDDSRRRMTTDVKRLVSVPV